jgi:hypothetical protein
MQETKTKKNFPPFKKNFFPLLSKKFLSLVIQKKKIIEKY